MKTSTLILSAATAAVLGIGALAATTTWAHGPGYGPGNMQGYGMMQQGQGFGPGYGMGQGQGFGPGQGWNENCLVNQGLDKPLSADDVRSILEQRVDRMGNDRLKVGDVKDKDDKTITAEIVTQDGSLVDRFEFDKTTGRHIRVK